MALHAFDRHYRSEKRKFQMIQQLEIEEIRISNPKEFWRHIKMLGPHSASKIPISVIDEDGNVSHDFNAVLQKWQSDFSELYNMTEANMYDDEFYDMVLKLKKEFEDEMSTMNFDVNDATIGEVSVNMMNVPITEGEVEKVLSHPKNGKAKGIDNLPNEVIKHEKTKRLLTRLFNVCFTKNIISSIWRKAIIMPTSKGHGKDPLIPLHDSGISLLSNLYKIYSSIYKYLESSGLLADEQNGFHRLHACIDHLFAITTIARNIKSRGESTFYCFVDMRRAFDLLDHDCLLYKTT